MIATVHIIRLFPLLIFLSGIAMSMSAQNLFPNPGFENYINCPTTLDKVDSCVAWDKVNSSDFYHGCSGYYGTFVIRGVPASGTGVIGGWMGGEGIYATLNSPLVPGTNYDIMFDLQTDGLGSISSAHGPNFCWDFGILFKTSATFSTADFTGGTPHVMVPGLSILNGTYTTFSFTFSPAQNFSHALLGGYNNANTPGASCNPVIDYRLYYNVDNLSIVPTPPLPAMLSAPYLVPEEDGLRVSWRSEEAEGLDYWAVEKSADGRLFAEISRRYPGDDWQVFDTDPSPGERFYRLRRMEKNGTASFSPIARYKYDRGAIDLHIRPNPVSVGERMKITWEGRISGDANIRLLDLKGKVIQEIILTGSGAPAFLEVPDLDPGIYFIRLAGKGMSELRKILILD